MIAMMERSIVVAFATSLAGGAVGEATFDALELGVDTSLRSFESAQLSAGLSVYVTEPSGPTVLQIFANAVLATSSDRTNASSDFIRRIMPGRRREFVTHVRNRKRRACCPTSSK
jgi:hypothetical protein